MSTVDKALKLLNFFTVNRPEVGLSDLARLAGYDKATTRRLLVSLAAYGFVEQDGRTRAYRLGGGASRLARIREAQFPLTQTAIPIMKELARDTGETVHLSEFSAGSLVTLHVELSPRAHRVNVDVGDVLPLHSTASGIAYLAFCGDDADDLVDRRRMTAYTSQTITDFGALGDAITAAARRGYAIGDQGFEEGVLGHCRAHPRRQRPGDRDARGRFAASAGRQGYQVPPRRRRDGRGERHLRPTQWRADGCRMSREGRGGEEP